MDIAEAKNEQGDDGGNGEEMVEPCRQVKLVLEIVLSQRRYGRQGWVLTLQIEVRSYKITRRSLL